MSERSERVIITAPKAHGCTIASNSNASAHDRMVHQRAKRSERVIITAPKAHGCTIASNSNASAHDRMVHQ